MIVVVDVAVIDVVDADDCFVAMVVVVDADDCCC